MIWTAEATWLRPLLMGIGAAVALHVARLPSLAPVTQRRTDAAE